MQRPKTKPAFANDEYAAARQLLAAKVISMKGRKLEEGDWSEVYCRAKGIPETGWSNLSIDVVHEGLGVEHKMLATDPRLPSDCYGAVLMHPAATRSIRIDSTQADPDDVMRDVLGQYQDLIDKRRDEVAKTGSPDLRFGWLLWTRDLREFLYFEEEMIPPDPADYYAEWHATRSRGARKASKSLWIFEKRTKTKRYSVTTRAGAKIQPYFDVPKRSDRNVYEFKIQGEPIGAGLMQTWVTRETADALVEELGGPDPDLLSQAVLDHADANDSAPEASDLDEVLSVALAEEAYEALQTAFHGATDEERLRAVLRKLQAGPSGK